MAGFSDGPEQSGSDTEGDGYFVIQYSPVNNIIQSSKQDNTVYSSIKYSSLQSTV